MPVIGKKASMDNTELIKDEIIVEFKRRINDEFVPRIKKSIAHLNDEELWYRPNENTVSASNLILHLCGNVRQWILSGLAEHPDYRKRQNEFNESGLIPRDMLLSNLDNLMIEVSQALHHLTVEDLLQKRPVQIYNETGISILIHVIEHFSYHTGQIVYFVKSKKNVDMQFYENVNLNNMIL